jgi:hypothetical protein
LHPATKQFLIFKRQVSDLPFKFLRLKHRFNNEGVEDPGRTAAK